MRVDKSGFSARHLTYAAMYLALALLLPFVTGQIPQIGALLCPMHLPVLLCGMICGPFWGAAVGFVAPLLRGTLFGMPVLFPTGVAMAFELMTYGLASGLLLRLLPRKPGMTLVSLVLAMLMGRIVWGCVHLVLAGLSHGEFTWALFLAGAFTNAVPGIVLQLVLIPPLTLAMERAGLSLNR